MMLPLILKLSLNYFKKLCLARVLGGNSMHFSAYNPIGLRALYVAIYHLLLHPPLTNVSPFCLLCHSQLMFWSADIMPSYMPMGHGLINEMGWIYYW